MEMKFDENGSPFVMWGANKIGLEKQPVTEKFFTEKAARELRETSEVVEQALRELRDLIKGEPALYVPSDNDEFLKRFLRPCKFYADSAFKRIQAYYKFRQNHVEYCEHLVPSVVQSVFQRGIISILAPRDQHGRRIMLVDSEKWNPRDVSLPEVFRGVQLSLEAAMEEPRTQISGVNVILDMAGLTFSQIMQFTPFFAKLIIDWIQDCIPIRLKAVHIVNQPYIFKMLFAIFKPFMREKLRSRIHFHGSDRASLLSHIDGKALRKRHGGNLPEPEVPGDVSWKMFSHFEDNFKLFNSYGYISNNNK